MWINTEVECRKGSGPSAEWRQGVLAGGAAFPVALCRQASTYTEVLRLDMADGFQEIRGHEKKHGFMFA